MRQATPEHTAQSLAPANRDPEVERLVVHYCTVLGILETPFLFTTDRAEFERWVGRRLDSRYGGAYIYLRRQKRHAILVNLARIDRSKPRALDIVVAEELLHLRDALDGDHRRHAKHGYDRIAHRVAELTGASLEEIRNCLIPVQRRPLRYRYACPGCGTEIWRRRRGTWSCARCSSHFDPRFVFQLVEDRGSEPTSAL